MNSFLFSILESFIFVIAISIDALIASLAYGCNKIKIPLQAMLEITLICTGILGASLLFGSLLKALIPVFLLKLISFLILFALGITRLIDDLIKRFIEHHTVNKEIKFSLLNLNFILNIYANPIDADYDHSKTISAREAFSIAISLSIDSLAAGVGAAFGNINIAAILFFSLILSMLSIKLGEFAGNKISDKIPFRLSWLSGILLIFLAVCRL